MTPKRLRSDPEALEAVLQRLDNEANLSKARNRDFQSSTSNVANARPVTLQTVLDRLADHPTLSESRKRDLRSAVSNFAKLRAQPPAVIRLDLAQIRQSLDRMVPAWAKVSRKRWANIRSDLAAAIGASGLQPMLKTADVPLDDAWTPLLASADRRVRLALLRFARWASLRGIAPQAVDERTIEQFIGDLDRATLVRNLRHLPRTVAKAWNALVARCETADLRPVTLPGSGRKLIRIPWQQLPASFRDDVEQYITWASVPDPLDEGARVKPLALRTLALRRDHIHSAISTALATGIAMDRLTSLGALVEPETFRALLRHRWRQDGRKLTAYAHGIAVTLIEIASEWVKPPADAVATLKALRSKLGTLPTGMTEKNTAMLRMFDDPRLVSALVQLPDKLWHSARRSSAKPQRLLINLQIALALDLLVHVPLRLGNLNAIQFDRHLNWPQGPRRPALIRFGGDETKNKVALEFELPTALSDRLHAYRNEIAPTLIGERPDAVFVNPTGGPRNKAAFGVMIGKTVWKHLGVKITPHQLRHLAAKIILDSNPGAYELVRQLLGHTSLKTTTMFYAGTDTRRAGRAHADLLMKLRASNSGSGRHRRTLPMRKD
jgi:integrase